MGLRGRQAWLAAIAVVCATAWMNMATAAPASTLHAQLLPGQDPPTPPFPTLAPTEPFPTLPPNVPTPSQFTPTATRGRPQTITPTPPSASPSPSPSASATPSPSPTIGLGLTRSVYLPFLARDFRFEEPTR